MNKNKSFRLAVATIAFFVVLAGTHLFIYAQNISLKYALTDLKVRFNELNSRNRGFASQSAREENLTFIEKTARDKLGMVYPEKINYIIVSREAGRTPN